MTRLTVTMPQWLPLLADNAHTASQDYEDCAGCRHRMKRGDRICRLPDGRWCHTGCISKTESHAQ